MARATARAPGSRVNTHAPPVACAQTVRTRRARDAAVFEIAK